MICFIGYDDKYYLEIFLEEAKYIKEVYKKEINPSLIDKKQ